MINLEGVLLNAEINFYNLGRNVEELMDEGDPTLTPSQEKVGKVH